MTLPYPLLRDPRVLAVASGVLLAFAAAPHDLACLTFGWAFLFAYALDTADDTGRTALRLGLLSGFACHAVAFHWVILLFSGHVPIPLPIAAALATVVWAAQALPFVAAAGLTRVLRGRGLPTGLALAVACPLAFSAVPMLFPWRPAEVLTGWPPLAQLAELSGPSVLDALAVAVGGLAQFAAHRRRPWAAAASVLIVVAMTVHGTLRIREVEALERAAPRVRLGLVQPNVTQGLKFDGQYARVHLDTLRTLSTAVEAQGAEVVVWPETAYPWPLPRGLPVDPAEDAGLRYRGATKVPVIFGAVTRAGGCDNRNTVFAMDGRRIVGAVDKVMLFPFSERVPFHAYLPFLHTLLPCPGFRPGEALDTLEVARTRFGILNCYEDLMPEPTRVLVRDRAPDLLLNVTNDAWFFDTAEPPLHHMAASLRAVETRRPLVRTVNTGVTGWFDASGRDVARLPVWQPGTLRADVPRLTGTTPYVRYGDRFTPVLGLGALALALARLIAGVRAASAAREP